MGGGAPFVVFGAAAAALFEGLPRLRFAGAGDGVESISAKLVVTCAAFIWLYLIKLKSLTLIASEMFAQKNAQLMCPPPVPN